jgi:hypothetical protein
MPLSHLPPRRRQRRVQHHPIHPLQLRLHPVHKLLDAVISAQVQRPDLHDGLAGRASGRVDLLLGEIPRCKGAYGQDDLGGAESGEVLGCLEAQAGVGAGDDVGAPRGEGGGGEEGEVASLVGDAGRHGGGGLEAGVLKEESCGGRWLEDCQ